MSDSWLHYGLCSPWNSPGQNTGVGSLSLLQGIFPTQGSSPGLPHCRKNLYQLRHKGSPRILAWVAYPHSSRSSQPRNWTGVSCIAGGFFTNWAIREALVTSWVDPKCNHEVPNERVRRKERRYCAAGRGEENFSSTLQFCMWGLWIKLITD